MNAKHLAYFFYVVSYRITIYTLESPPKPMRTVIR